MYGNKPKFDMDSMMKITKLSKNEINAIANKIKD